MKSIRRAIEEGQKKFSALPFFKRLERPGSLEDARTFIPALTFFVVVFQDVLRLNEERMQDPSLRAVAREHRSEDDQHEQWFLKDLERLSLAVDVRWVFSPAHAATRDASYAIMSEVFRAKDDYARLALILVLEATGEVFFERVPRYMEETGLGGIVLEYFSHMHAAVEKGHALFEAKVRALLDEMKLSPAMAREGLAMAERTFAAMTSMVQAFEARIVEQAAIRTNGTIRMAP
jgi:hypothetical protein